MIPEIFVIPCHSMKNYYDLLARIFVSFIFLYQAYDSIVFFKSTKETMTEYGITWQQDILLSGVIFLLIVGSILILIGYYASIGAFLILLYWIPYTIVIHDFWNHPVDFRMESSLNFMQNIGLVAALLLLMSHGARDFSVRRVLHVLKLPEE